MTVTQINKLLKPLRGRVATYDRFILFYLIFGLVIAASVGVIFWVFLHYAISIAIGIVYFTILGSFVYVTKRRTSTLIKKAHLCLSLFLHIENNRYYKNKQIVLRPGYMAKWVEIIYLAPLIAEEENAQKILRKNNYRK